MLINLSALFALSDSYAVFKDPGFGARPMAMGGAFTAVADDSNAPLYNPAGITQAGNPQIGLSYAKLFSGLENVDLSLQYFSALYPYGEIGSFGISWTYFSANYHRENTVNITYARSIERLFRFKGNWPEISFGANAKYLSHSYILDDYSRNDPVFASGSSKSNFTADLGLWAKLKANKFGVASAGIAVKNITQPDMGILTEDNAAAETRVGAAYKIRKLGSMKNLIIASDLVYRNIVTEQREKNISLSLGAEAWFLNEMLAARLGGNSGGLTCGFGVKKNFGDYDIIFDYALLWPLQLISTTGSHRVSLSCGF